MSYIEKLNSYFIPDIEPLALTNLKLSAPKNRDNKPTYYSLGADSTVPFVSFQGGGQNQKVFSWGESIKVDPGSTVTVKSESYMRGDIQINSGLDVSVRPARISVPVPFETFSFDFDGNTYYYFKPLFPADTRMCRRAYINFQLNVENNVTGIAYIYGKARKHSFPSSLTPMLLLNIGTISYETSYRLTPYTSYSQLPLGYGEAAVFDPLAPMALTDMASFFFGYWTALELEEISLNSLIMYVIEY